MIFLDTETLGLHGLPVLIQYAYDDGDIRLYNIWREPIDDTLELIEDFCNHPAGICGFNLAFDWFQICKVYTTWRLLRDRDTLPLHQIDDVAAAEKEARNGPCLKPQAACDLMLHARKGPYQSTMDRKDITIKRIPTVLAELLIDELNNRIPLKDIYFSRKSDPKQRWRLQDVVDDLGEDDPRLKNIVLNFAPSSALKSLAVDALGIEEDKVLKFSSINPPSYKKVDELGYAPFALAVGEPGNWGFSWPFWVWSDVFFWDTNERARRYAKDDVIYTRALYYHFGCPSSDDVDSQLACMVAAVRWRGFTIDVEAVKSLKQRAEATIKDTPFNVNSAEACKKYLKQVMSDVEYGILSTDGKTSTKKVLLEEIAKWSLDAICPYCEGDGCEKCPEGTGEPHPAAMRASQILEARSAHKEVELYAKLLKAGRFHASFKVIGALSSRMAGADGLNAQGIKRADYVRRCFSLKNKDQSLSSGDFDAFEMAIMDAAYHDPKMRADLTGPYKFHALIGQLFFPHHSYDDIIKTKGSANPWHDLYSRSKQGVFAMMYGGEGYTLTTRVGISEEVANEAYNKILAMYPEYTAKRQAISSKFCSMKQPKGIGTKVEWSEPAEYVESLLGFKRYFTLENQICKALFDLAEDPPKAWTHIKQTINRRDREQTVSGALRSALFAAAFAIQSSNMRAAGNHIIQSTGAEITKKLQAKLWGFQPCGIYPWKVQVFNVHDELNVVHAPELADDIAQSVDDFILDTSLVVPLIAMDWQSNIDNWAGKGGTKEVNEDTRGSEMEELI